MNQDAANASMIKKARRALLDALLLFEVAADYRSIRNALPTIDNVHVRRDIKYLIDKGYVRRVNERPNQNEDDREYVLTAAGMERAQRIIVDPALEP